MMIYILRSSANPHIRQMKGMKITVTEEAKNDNDFKFLEMRILLYLAKEGKGPFCSEVSFPVGSPPMSDCNCWGQLDHDLSYNDL